MNKKLGMWIGIIAAVAVVAAIVLLIVLTRVTLPQTPAEFGKTFTENNYTVVTTMTIEDKATEVTMKCKDGKNYIKYTVNEVQTEYYVEKVDSKYKVYTYNKDDSKWYFTEKTEAEAKALIIVETFSGTEELFKDDNFDAAEKVFTYKGESKQATFGEFTSLTVEIKSDSVVMTIVANAVTRTYTYTDIGKTNVNIPSAEATPA